MYVSVTRTKTKFDCFITCLFVQSVFMCNVFLFYFLFFFVSKIRLSLSLLYNYMYVTWRGLSEFYNLCLIYLISGNKKQYMVNLII